MMFRVRTESYEYQVKWLALRQSILKQNKLTQKRALWDAHKSPIKWKCHKLAPWVISVVWVFFTVTVDKTIYELLIQAIDRFSIIWKSDPSDKIKRDFFQAVAVLGVLYKCTSWTNREKARSYLHENAMSCFSWLFCFTAYQHLLGHLTPNWMSIQFSIIIDFCLQTMKCQNISISNNSV